VRERREKLVQDLTRTVQHLLDERTQLLTEISGLRSTITAMDRTMTATLSAAAMQRTHSQQAPRELRASSMTAALTIWQERTAHLEGMPRSSQAMAQNRKANGVPTAPRALHLDLTAPAPDLPTVMHTRDTDSAESACESAFCSNRKSLQAGGRNPGRVSAPQRQQASPAAATQSAAAMVARLLLPLVQAAAAAAAAPHCVPT
jgi:hypothetical protein